MAATLSLITITPDPGGSSFLRIYATSQRSPGASRPGRRSFKLLFITPAGLEPPVDLLPSYTAIFGHLISGKRIFFRLDWCSSKGIPSAEFRLTKDVT